MSEMPTNPATQLNPRKHRYISLVMSVAVAISAWGCEVVDDSSSGNVIAPPDNGVGSCSVAFDTQDSTLQLPTLSPFATLSVGDGVLIAGAQYNRSTDANQLAVAKYHATGELDRSFGRNGHAVLGALEFWRGSDYSAALAVDSSDRILFAGAAKMKAAIVGRLLADGTLDTTFGDKVEPTSTIRTGSRLWPSSNAWRAIRSLSVRPDGRVVVAGDVWGYQQDVLVGQLSREGEVDLAFGNDATPGWLSVEAVGGQSAFGVWASDDETIAAGGLGFGLTHFFADGASSVNSTLPASKNVFGGYAQQAVFDRDGSVLLAGTTKCNRLGLAKFDVAMGSDTDFGINGATLTDFPHHAETPASCGGWSRVLGLAETTAAIYVYTLTAQQLYVTKFLRDGQLVKEYGDSGSYRIRGPQWQTPNESDREPLNIRYGNLLSATHTNLVAVGFDHRSTETRPFITTVPF